MPNQNSPQVLSVQDPRVNGNISPAYFRDLEVMPFNFTQSGAGVIGDTATIILLQKGRYFIYPRLSIIRWSAFGASSTLNIGLTSYTDEAGATVAASTSRFDSAVNNAAAGSANMGSSLAAADFRGISVNVGGTSNSDGCAIICTFNGANPPAAATLDGYLVLSRIP